MTEAQEARDKQRRTCEQRDRERDLRSNEKFAEALLAEASRCAAAAFF